MNALLGAIKFYLAELIIVVAFFLSIPSSTPEIITGDGVGYYEYLPSIFIHHDFVRIHSDESQKTDFQQRTAKFGFYTKVDDHWVNRYPCGTAILEAPFFLVTWPFTDMSKAANDGYQPSFHRAARIAALFYLLLTLLFFKKLLALYNVRKSIILLSQVLLVFATSVTQYATSNAAFSHVYSLFAITAFLFFARKYFQEKEEMSFLWMSVFWGLIVILRNVNVIVVLALPFIAGSWDDFSNGFRHLFKKPFLLTKGAILFIGVVFIQLLAWYLQSGNWLVYSYSGYGFNFFDPQFLKMLFSYRKGLFVYTPVLLLGVAGVFYWLFKKEYYRFFSWMFFFIILTYILSSWQFWYYGDSYGSRVYIDFYVFFFLPFGLLLSRLNLAGQIVLIALSTVTVPINLIQTYQYKKYIIHHSGMDRDRYWKVFLRTDERFYGIFYRKRIDEEDYQTLASFDLEDVYAESKTKKLIWQMTGKDFDKYNDVQFIRLQFDNQFSENEKSRVIITIDDVNKNNKLYHRPYLLHFATGEYGSYQKGIYNYQIPKLEDLENLTIRLILCAGDQPCRLDNVRVTLFSHK